MKMSTEESCVCGQACCIHNIERKDQHKSSKFCKQKETVVMGAASPAIQVWTPVIPSDTSPKMWYLNTCRWKPPSGLQKLATFRYKNQDPNSFSNLNWEYVNQSIPMPMLSKDVENLQLNLLPKSHLIPLAKRPKDWDYSFQGHS